MALFSFIDFGERDFLRNSQGQVLQLEFSGYDQAENWLLDNGKDYGWTNEGVRFWCWEEEE